MRPFFLLALAAVALSSSAGSMAAGSPALKMTVTPAATGRQLVRASLPFPEGWLHENEVLLVSGPHGSEVASVRPLTWYPQSKDRPRTVRRALVAFGSSFDDLSGVVFEATPVAADEEIAQPVANVEWTGTQLRIERGPGETAITAEIIAPPRAVDDPPHVETVERSVAFLWQRYRFADPRWPRIIEVRIDAAGTIALAVHLQRSLEANGRAPDFGWNITWPDAGPVSLHSDKASTVGVKPVRFDFKDGSCASCRLAEREGRIDQPSAAVCRRGHVEARVDADNTLTYRYLRCTADERVPMQQAAWRRAWIVIGPLQAAPLTPTLLYPHDLRVEQPEALAARLPDAGSPLRALLAYHREAVVRSAVVGDDYGNVVGYMDGRNIGDGYGMNRLNHCPAIFFDADRSGNRRLLGTAIAWCDNFYDQSIWWGPKDTGGTRYNNMIAQGVPPFEGDASYMWRSNYAVSFTTKGYDSFMLAYERTGDPRMLEALHAQTDYAAQTVHCDRGECRNIGDVADFVRLYELTGKSEYLGHGLRLFRELRTKLSGDNLFDQGGKSIEPDPPFIEEDKRGLEFGYAKPYIIGYALNGLPSLARHRPDEPRLRETVQAVADFLAETQDPVGGWRYPHPASSWLILNQAIEHAWQLVQADRLLGPQEAHLDAIERVLRQRLHGWLDTGKVFSGIQGWEMSTGRVTERKELYGLYKRPADRDPTRDYTEGQASFGTAPPEGLVYFAEVLAFYLEHRPEAALLRPPTADEPLGMVLDRLPKTAE